ncbi:MAG: HAD family hydrolase [Phycisphaerales bacterium]|nr:HAD family hydrolase [Phycisphaerales bacterium]
MIIFDLDDTLYAERDYVLSGYRAICEHLGNTPASSDEMRQWLWDRFLSGRSDNAFGALSSHFKLDLDTAGIAELVTVYRDHRPAITLRRGMGDLLDKLRGRCKLGIISDGFLPAQKFKLDALGIGDYFDAVLFTESIGREFWKPSPVGFQTICEELKADPEACVYIGDNPSKDFVAPNALGWRTIQLLLDGQIHSHKPAPSGGRPGLIAGSIDELTDMIG